MLLHMHEYFPLLGTLKIISAVPVSNLVSEKLHPLALTKEKILLLQKSVLTVKKLVCHLSGSQCSKLGKDWLKIEGTRDY